jgi:peroxiredoxin
MHHVFRVATAALAVALLAGPAQADHHKEQSAGDLVGKSAPNFELPAVSNGKKHSLKDFRGQVVVLHFQQISCPWEANYQADLNRLAKQYAKQQVGGESVQVQFLAINSNKTESASRLKAFKAGDLEGQLNWEHPAPSYPLLKDAGNKVADKYHARTTPHIYVIDRDGVLRYAGGVETPPSSPAKAGDMDTQFLEPVLKALINGSQMPYQVTKTKGCGIKRVN